MKQNTGLLFESPTSARWGYVRRQRERRRRRRREYIIIIEKMEFVKK